MGAGGREIGASRFVAVSAAILDAPSVLVAVSATILDALCQLVALSATFLDGPSTLGGSECERSGCVVPFCRTERHVFGWGIYFLGRSGRGGPLVRECESGSEFWSG